MKALGIDLGGSHVTAIIMDATGAVSQRSTLAIDDRSLDVVVHTIRECVAGISESFQAIGMAVPGNVDPFNGTARYLPSFGWEQEVPLGDILKQFWGLPIEMRNDGRCAALAESRFGVGRGSAVFAVLTLGTGIGGALIQNGHLFDGCSFDAGDFGHHVIRSGSAAFACVCGKRGCFESHASAQGLIRHYEREGGLAENAAQVMAAVRSGEVQASHAFETYIDDLATGLANLVTFYNPDIIALGGGLSQAAEVFENLQALVDEKTLPATRGRARVVPSALGPDAGAIGAALLGLSSGVSNAVEL
jgi:glucokinase